MALLNILQFPDPRLKKIAEPIDTFDQDIVLLARNMLETMYETRGVGLAATQVNVHKQLIVMDVSEKGGQPHCFINPEIIDKRGNIDWDEGCLSFPGVYARVARAREVTLRYRDIEGRLQTLDAEGLLAVCIQHETDHLSGITFFDHLSPLKRSLLMKKLEKNRRKSL